MKQGYKQTEVGVIPSDWEVDKLKRFWSVTDCKHITAEFIQSGIPVASIGEVQSRFVNLKDAKQTTDSYYRQLIEGGRKPQAGDLIFSRNATVGKTAQVAEWHPIFAMGQDVCLLRKLSPEYASDYLQSVLQFRMNADQITNLMVGSTFKRVNVEQIRNLIIAMPPIHEQRRIAEALADVDRLLAALDKLIAKKRAVKTAAMQQLLTGQIRLPGFGHEWKDVLLGSIGKFNKGRGIKKDQVQDFGLPCIRYGEIYTRHDDYIKEFYSFITPEIADESQRLKLGDLLFAGSGETAEEIGKCVAFLGNIEAYAGGDIVILSPKKQNSQFLGYLMNHAHIVEQKASMGQGDAVVHIQAKNLAKLQFRLPPQDEQTAIAEILSDMDAELAALAARRSKTAAVKQGMMQDLLTGRVRLVPHPSLPQGRDC